MLGRSVVNNVIFNKINIYINQVLVEQYIDICLPHGTSSTITYFNNNNSNLLPKQRPSFPSCARQKKMQNLLLEHHGRVSDLILCKGAFTQANELTDEMQTLKGYGVKGAPRGVEPPVIVPLFYDFKPVAYDEPLLLVSVPYDPQVGILEKSIYMTLYDNVMSRVR